MNKKGYLNILLIIIVFLFSLTFNQSEAKADVRLNLNLNQEINPALELEYLFSENMSVMGAYEKNEDIFSSPYMIKVGARYYFFDAKYSNYTEESGPFAELSVGNPVIDDEYFSDINLGGGYIYSLSNNVYLSAGAGYSYSQAGDDGIFARLGVNISVFDLIFREGEIEQETYLEERYDWEEEIIEAVVNEEIFQDMHKTQVRESWGNPDRTVEGGGVTYWLYEKFDFDTEEFRQLLLFFENEKLDQWIINDIDL